jgi:hypothetical protein
MSEQDDKQVKIVFTPSGRQGQVAAGTTGSASRQKPWR